MDKMDWTTINSEYIITDKWMNLRVDTCRMPDGRIVEPYYILEYPSWLNVAAITKEKELILVRQYRHASGKTLIELPGGCMEKEDKTPLEAARRELLEETGYRADNFTEISSMYPNPSSHNNRVYGFLAMNAEFYSIPNLDYSEEIEVILKPLNEAVKMLKNQEFLQPMHAATLFYALMKLGMVDFNLK